MLIVLLACSLAVASAGHLGLGLGGPVGHAYHGPLHLPVINGEGVPVDTADVQHARAAHLSQKAVVHARDGYYGHGDGLLGHAGGYGGAHGGAYLAGSVLGGGYLGGHGGAGVALAGHGVGPIGYHGPAAYPTTAVHPVSVHGVPLDTPEVAAAAANHLAAHHEALARTAHAGHGHYRKRRGIYGGAGHLGYGGAGHLGYEGAGHLGYAGAGHLAYAAPAYHGPIHLPVINGEGVPVDTADVQHARAAHLTQRANVVHRNGDAGLGHGGYGGHAGLGGYGGLGGWAGHGGYAGLAVGHGLGYGGGWAGHHY